MQTQSEEIQEKRYRNFMILLYPEWDNFNDILFDLKGSFKNYAYIKHDREEEEKKVHIHFILNIDNPRSITSLSKRINVPDNLIQPIKSLRASCRYLIHLDSDQKKEYELASVTVSNSFRSTFFRSFDDLKSDDDILQDIYDFINDYSDQTNAIQLEVLLTQYVLSNGYDKIFKRYYNTISKFILYKCDQV